MIKHKRAIVENRVGAEWGNQLLLLLKPDHLIQVRGGLVGQWCRNGTTSVSIDIWLVLSDVLATATLRHARRFGSVRLVCLKRRRSSYGGGGAAADVVSGGGSQIVDERGKSSVGFLEYGYGPVHDVTARGRRWAGRGRVRGRVRKELSGRWSRQRWAIAQDNGGADGGRRRRWTATASVVVVVWRLNTRLCVLVRLLWLCQELLLLRCAIGELYFFFDAAIYRFFLVLAVVK